MILVYITSPNKKVARQISSCLLRKRLIGCANIFGIDSLYWWKGKIEKSKEFVVLGKTVEKNYQKIRSEIEKIHPYEIPCILKIKVKANEKYLRWLEKEIE